MNNHYFVFIHGVNTRKNRDAKGYSDILFNKIIKNYKNQTDLTTEHIKRVELYWGDVNKKEEDRLLNQWKNSIIWKQLLFKKYREHQILQFIGDAALYISQFVGSEMINQIHQQLKSGLINASINDKIHIVAHSWGTIILFDVLFSNRWDNNLNVQKIRKSIYGIQIESKEPVNLDVINNYKISSIHTMGSPISIFQLMYIIDNIEHDSFSNRLKTFIEGLYQKSGTVIWNNYIHPGDPIAYPLEIMLIDLLKITNKKEINISDIILPISFWKHILNNISDLITLIRSGNHHGSYWDNDIVVENIIECIKE